MRDAEGRPLGRSMDRDGFWIHVDAAGLRVLIDSFSGLPFARSLIYFTERDCQGVAVGSRRDAPGDVIAYGLRDLLFVGTETILPSVTVQSEVLFGSACRNLAAPLTLGAVRELALLEQHELGFELPVALPLRFGTGPLGEIEEEIVDACAGPRGQLRLAEPGTECRPDERPLAWQRLGGLRVYDGVGREVGAALGTVASQSALGILLPEGGGWIEPDPLTGALAPPTRVYAEPDCEGQAFVFDFFLRNAGQVFPDTPLDLEPLVERSLHAFTGCSARSLFPDPVLSTRLEPFTGVVPFPLPVTTPLRVGAGN